VETPTTVLLLVRTDVLDHLELGLGGQVRTGDVAGDDAAGHEEHGTSVVGRDVAILALNVLEEFSTADSALLDLTQEILGVEAVKVDLGLLGEFGGGRSVDTLVDSLRRELLLEPVLRTRSRRVLSALLDVRHVPVVDLVEILLVDGTDGRNTLVGACSGGGSRRTGTEEIRRDVLLAEDIVTSVRVAQVAGLGNDTRNINLLKGLGAIIDALNSARVEGDVTLTQRSGSFGTILEHVSMHNTICHKRKAIVGDTFLGTNSTAIFGFVRNGLFTIAKILPHLTTLLKGDIPHLRLNLSC